MSKGKHVKVIIRTRPTSDYAQDMLNLADRNSIHVHIPKNAEGGYINNQQEDWGFKFDNILHNVSQDTVYEECANSVTKSLLDGYNGTIMAYGQTGAGKTFTMTGATENYKHRGLIPRSLSHIFREIHERPQLSFAVRVSYIEIYNEQMVDLLGNLHSALKGDTALTVTDDKSGFTQVKGLTTKLVNSEEEALSYLFEGETARSIAEHQLNRNSSRSHCIFTVYVESRSRVESSEKIFYSKLNLVDLAGSERLSKTQTTGVSLREAMYINKSLTFLEQVIIALADKKRGHIPYRQSKLTNLLRDALGGNCYTLMIANIRCEAQYIDETISTLRFATRMACVMNTPEHNIQYDPVALIKKYEKEIRELKQELSMHDTLSSRSHVQHDPFTETQKMEIQKQVKHFVQSEEEELEVVSLRQIREMLAQFRLLYRTLEQEHEDLQRASRVHGQSAGGKEDGRETHTSTRADEKDDGVGEVEGSGFGIGLAPNTRQVGGMAAATGSSRAARDKKRKNSRVPPNPVGNLPGSASRGGEQEDEDSKLEDGRFAGRKVSEGAMADSHNFPQLAAMMGNGQHARQIAPPLSRADEFESFKKGKGADIHRILIENKTALREKRIQARDLAESVNEVKKRIDTLRYKVDEKKAARLADTAQPTDELIIDEDEYMFLNSLKEAKVTYREQYQMLRNTRSDIEYCGRLVDQCRQRLMAEFEQWYELQYGGQPVDEGMEGQIEDTMDIGEKFDRLQVERMSLEDPDSLPFYNAKKNTERRFRVVRKH